MTPTFVVLKRGVPHPDPDRHDTLDVLCLRDEQGRHLTWAGQADLYEAGDSQAEFAMSLRLDQFDRAHGKPTRPPKET